MNRRQLLATLLLLVGLILGLDADRPSHRHVFTYANGTFVPLLGAVSRLPQKTAPPCPPLPLPGSWDVRDALYVDLTGDDNTECVLLVWRPWRDWPIMRWSETESPIATHRDDLGDSAHVILVTPHPEDGYLELWAGSALADPLLKITTGDVDGNGQRDLVALEGDYAKGREGTAHYVTIWHWNGFGFTLDWRSDPGRYREIQLADTDGDGILDIIAW
ncbi:MAG: FG-GAP repeat domain-containing protein [Anaerolineae bacterium]